MITDQFSSVKIVFECACVHLNKALNSRLFHLCTVCKHYAHFFNDLSAFRRYFSWLGFCSHINVTVLVYKGRFAPVIDQGIIN